MNIDFNTFLNMAIDSGKAAAIADYTKPEDKDRLEGSLAGFEACRGLDTAGLLDLFYTANNYMQDAYRDQLDYYWYFACYKFEVEWIINVVSGLLLFLGQEALLSYLPTVNGMKKAHDIINSMPTTYINYNTNTII